MVREQVTRCDRCEKKAEGSVQVLLPDETVREIDVCETHLADIVELFANGRPSKLRTPRHQFTVTQLKDTPRHLD